MASASRRWFRFPLGFAFIGGISSASCGIPENEEPHFGESDAAIRSSGCGFASPTGVSSHSIVVDGTTRTYLLSVPTNYDPSATHRLIFAWHGFGGSGSSIRSHNVEYGLGSSEISVYPDGLYIQQYGGTGWDLIPTGRDVALFDALSAYLESRYCIDTARVMSYGFSLGGYMTNLLGCVRGDRIRALAVVSGGWPALATSCAAIPIAYWASHADDDWAVSITTGRQARDHWRTLDACGPTTTPVYPSPCVRYNGCIAGDPVVWCEVATGGHNWFTWDSPGIAAFLNQF
jgi:polyhydroxybutyrate depolymerase